MARATLDTRDSPQDLPGTLGASRKSAVGVNAYLSRLRHPPPHCATVGPHGDGLCGPEQRNGVESSARLKKPAGCTSATVDCYFVEWLLLVGSAQLEVRPRAGFRTSPKRVFPPNLNLEKRTCFAFCASGLDLDVEEECERRCPASSRTNGFG